MPAARLHNTTGLECWCEPELTQACPECESSDVQMERQVCQPWHDEVSPNFVKDELHANVPDEMIRRMMNGVLLVKAIEGCWRCGGRGVVDQYDDHLPLIIIHRKTE